MTKLQAGVINATIITIVLLATIAALAWLEWVHNWPFLVPEHWRDWIWWYTPL